MFGLTKPQSKAQAGAKLAQLQNQAPDSIPGMFKPGEFVLPPDTVHAMGGKQALQNVVDATHTPVTPQGQPVAGRGLKVPQQQPEVFFANGGAPEDQLAKRAPVSPSNIFPQASPSAGANIYAGAGLSREQLGSSGKLAQVPAGIGGNPSAPAPKPNSFGDAAAATRNTDVKQVSAPAPASMGATSAPAASAPPASAPTASAPPSTVTLPAAPASNTAQYFDDRTDDVANRWKAGDVSGAIGSAVRTGIGTVGMAGVEALDKTFTPAFNAVGGFAQGLLGLNDAQAAPASTAAPASNPAATPPAKAAVPDGYTHKSQGTMGPPDLSKLSGQTAAEAPSAPATSASQPGELPTGVYNHGRGQYSDQAAGMGFPAGFTGRPNAQNMAAAANLSAGNAAPAAGQAQEGGFGFSAPAVAHSGNDWAARQRLKDMETAASSITNRAEWRNGSSAPAWSSRQQPGINDADGKIARFNAATQADLVAQGKAPDAQLKTNELNAGLQRAAMAEAGADRRAQGQLGLGFGQLALGAQRNQLDAQRISNDERLRAPQIRAAERLGQLQDAYINAKTPEEQAAIAAQIRAYSGKVEEDRWKAVALQGGTDAQGNKTESLLGAVNERTGEMRRMGQGGSQQPASTANQELVNPATRPVGTVSTVGGKQAVWDGKQWVPKG